MREIKALRQTKHILELRNIKNKYTVMHCITFLWTTDCIDDGGPVRLKFL